MDDIVEACKTANRIEDVIEETGTPLARRRGRYLHGQEHDSLVVDTQQQYYLWNSKGESGDVITWLQKRKGMDFKTAVEYLARRAKLPEPRWTQENNEVRLATRAREDALEIGAQVFRRRLQGSQEAREYAARRGWTEETVREAWLGYTGEGSAEERKDLLGELQLHGIEPGSQAAKAVLGIPGRMLVYVHRYGGRVRYLSMRSVGEKRHYNLPSDLVGQRQVYYNQAYGGEVCVIVEGQADAVTLGQWGIGAVALAGTSWKDQGEMIRQIAQRHEAVYVGLDGDEAGLKALIGARKDWPLAQVVGPLARVVQWPREREGDKDANDWLQAMVQRGLDAQGQRVHVDEALAASRTMVEAAAAWAGELKGEERDRGLSTLFGIVGMMDRQKRAMYRSRLCGLANVGLREFNDILKAGTEEKARPEGDVEETLGGYIHGWLVEYLYDPDKQEARLAYRDPSGKMGTAETLEIEGRTYAPKYPNGFIKDGGVLFASELGELRSTRELTAIIEAFVTAHYLLENRYLAKIIAYYVLLTWVYDAFNALPYLRAIGEAGAGKSELMRRIGHLCYRLMTASGANTGSSFFRGLEQYRGTVFIDEADLADGGDMANDIVKFLNLGAMRGNPIWRLQEEISPQGTKSYEVQTFQTFGPKLIAMRKEFRDDAVASRSLTIKLMPREPIELKMAGIRLYIDDEFRRRALGIRNLLLRWRMEKWRPEIQVGEEFMDLEISSRLNQVTMPIKALAADDDELRGEIEKFLRAYNQEMVLSRSMTIAARVVEALWKIYRYPDLRAQHLKKTPEGYEFMMIGDVRQIANEIMDEMNDTGEDKEEEGGKKRRNRDELSARGVGHIIRNELQLQVGQRRGTGFPVFWDPIKMQALGKRFGVDWEHIGTNGNGSAAASTPTAALQGKMEV